MGSGLTPRTADPQLYRDCLLYTSIDKTERKQSTAAETIAVPVYQPDRFQVSPPSFVEEIRQNEETTISQMCIRDSLSPVETFGGGIVLDASPYKHRRGDEEAIGSLHKKETRCV